MSVASLVGKFRVLESRALSSAAQKSTKRLGERITVQELRRGTHGLSDNALQVLAASHKAGKQAALEERLKQFRLAQEKYLKGGAKSKTRKHTKKSNKSKKCKKNKVKRTKKN
jgi:hypothetical protein